MIQLFASFVALSTSIVPTPSLVAQTPVARSDRRFQQIALTVNDLDRARLFYRDRLGLPLLFEANGMLFFDVSGTRLMIALDRQRQTPRRPTSILYFDAPDFIAALEQLRASGAVLEGPVETVQKSASGELRLQQFLDPDGNMLAIMGTVPVAARAD